MSLADLFFQYVVKTGLFAYIFVAGLGVVVYLELKDQWRKQSRMEELEKRVQELES